MVPKPPLWPPSLLGLAHPLGILSVKSLNSCMSLSPKPSLGPCPPFSGRGPPASSGPLPVLPARSWRREPGSAAFRAPQAGAVWVPNSHGGLARGSVCSLQREKARREECSGILHDLTSSVLGRALWQEWPRTLPPLAYRKAMAVHPEQRVSTRASSVGLTCGSGNHMCPGLP